MSPPATATTELTLEHIEREGDTGPSSQRKRLRLVVDVLGVTRCEAKARLAAYERERALANARRIGNDTHRSDADFIHWLMRQAPTSRNRPVLKHGWRTR